MIWQVTNKIDVSKIFSDLMTCSLSLEWLFSFFKCWLYTLIALFLLEHSLIVGLCSNGKLAIVWRLLRSTFTEWFIMSCSTSSFVLVNSIWSWSLHVLHDQQFIHLFMTLLPASSAWLNTFWHYITKASPLFSHCSLLKLHISYCCLASLSPNNGKSRFTWYPFLYKLCWFEKNVSCMLSLGWFFWYCWTLGMVLL